MKAKWKERHSLLVARRKSDHSKLQNILSEVSLATTHLMPLYVEKRAIGWNHLYSCLHKELTILSGVEISINNCCAKYYSSEFGI